MTSTTGRPFFRAASRAVDAHASRVLLVGNPTSTSSAHQSEKLLQELHMSSVGWLSTADRVDGQKVLGSPADSWQVLNDTAVEAVVLCPPVDGATAEEIRDAATVAGCRVFTLNGAVSPSDKRTGASAISLTEWTLPLLRRNAKRFKRIADILGASLGLVVLSPVFGVLALLVRADSSGPALFAQERVGRHNKKFRLWKFRTMRRGAEGEKAALGHLNVSRDNRLFKIKEDPRVTRVGRWLRRWSLDELPQLWNVLKGDMSLVGPRPFFEADLQHYRPPHFIRLIVDPGITGLWQVNGRSDIVDFDEVVRLDRDYLRRWSPWLDLLIVLRTIPAVIRRRGAY